MQGMYGNKFLDMWRDTDPAMVKALWAAEMGKLTNDELRRGFSALMAQEWPPSLPQYIKLCKPSVDSMVAYYEAVAGVQARAKGDPGVWSHPAIYWASVPLSFDLGSLPFSQIKTRWERALSEQMDKGEWEAIPQPKLALSDIGKTMLSREKAGQLMQEYKASDVVKTPRSGVDHLAWAKIITQREKSKDKSLSMIQIRLAKEALGLAT
ncbi:hypothetical protein C7W93_07085 [Glaciimonas sp. PCH181]|nr:hypothetical protein C7W93_07085 [Glaciimonas sp. PCH181]